MSDTNLCRSFFLIADECNFPNKFVIYKTNPGLVQFLLQMGFVESIRPSFQKSFLQSWSKVDRSWRFAICAFLVVRLVYAVWSWAILTVQPLAVQNFALSNESILTIFNLQDSQSYAYARTVNGKILSFQAAGPSMVRDEQTGSLWDISTGVARQGPQQGSTLAHAQTAPSDIFPYHNTKPYPNRWLAIWQRFDANWYASIAETGYGNITGDAHFPPLFPALIRLLNPLVDNAFLAGLFLSHLAALYAFKLLYDVFLEWGEETTTTLTIVLMILYPASFFLFSAYSESLFLVSALLALRCMKQRSWAWAGLWVFCAILTRLQGIALLFPMAYLMWQDRPFLGRFSHWFGLGVAGFSGLFYLFLRSTQSVTEILPLVERDLHARLALPWENYEYAIQTISSGRATFIDVLNWGVTTIFILLIIWGWKKIPLEYNLYAVASMIAITIRLVETQPLNSMSRYALTIFPSFYSLALIGENPWLRRLILYTFIPLNLYLSAQFFLWGWVA